jgi:TPP-dependent indolepyruvate ferredoxin oxidoreductase alpha subunit
MKKFLSANEAVAHAAAQAGCVVASAYPGTPSTEILENIAKFKDTIERIIGEQIEIPAKLQEFMKGEKQSIPMAPTLDALKQYLLG